MPHSEIGKAPSLRVFTISARRCVQSAHGTPLFKRLCISNESFWPRRSTGTHTALALTASEGRFSADSDSTYMPSKREISTVVNRVVILSNIGLEKRLVRTVAPGSNFRIQFCKFEIGAYYGFRSDILSPSLGGGSRTLLGLCHASAK